MVLIRRVRLGRVPTELVARQRAVYEGYAGRQTSFGQDQTIGSDDPAELAERIAEVANEVGANALNLRVQLPGMSPSEVRDQIARIGDTVVGPLGERWPSRHSTR
jgi:hypothetical protein